MKIVFLFMVIAMLRPTSIAALFEKEVGVNDFLIATTGHGSIQTLYTCSVKGEAHFVLTSDSVDAGKLMSTRAPTSCFVALRNTSTGSLIWRRNVCSTNAKEAHHVVTAADEAFFTVDHTGLLRAWTTQTGALMWDSSFVTTAASTPIRMWLPDPTLLAIANDDTLTFYSATNGRVLGAISAAGSSTGKAAATWLTVFIQGEHLFSLVGTVRKGIVSQMTLVSLVLDEGVAKIVSTTALGNHPKFVASSLQIIQGAYIVGLGTDGTNIVHVPIIPSESSQQIDLPQWHPLWTSMEKLEPHAGGLLRITGVDNRYSPPRSSVGLFRFNGKDFWDQWYAIDGSEETQFRAMGYCPEASLVFTLQQDASINPYHVGNIAVEEGGRLTRSERHQKNSPLTQIQVDGDSSLSLTDDISGIFVLACKADSATFFVTTTMGSTATLVLSKNSMDSVTAQILWTAEEGLSSVSSGLLLDASHSSAIVDATSAEEKTKTLQALSFSSRLKSQAVALADMLTSFTTLKTREDEFGFSKVALLLSQTTHRVWGVPTSGSGRGNPSWMMNLPKSASRHVLVQGTASTSSTVNGINAGTHSHEVLILSILLDETQWTCLDGTTGVVHGSGSSPTPASIRQIIPIFGGGSCRQVAMLLLDDGSVSIIPNDDKAVAAVAEKVKMNENSFYAHIFNKGRSNMETYQIIESTQGSSFTTRLVGQTTFPGEKIVNVAYPRRDEVINSPCDILGDDSLLLKYLNPHMVAVVTISESPDSPTGPLARAINPMKGVTGKTKPKGVAAVLDLSDDTSSKSSPNFFVNLVDTVSGRILYRESHANAVSSASNPILINENWVIYSFFNEVTKRSELGVLSMHEGMIDKSGLNAFTTPEQAGSFSSLSARDSKPVVLAKTYAITKPITALGVTATKGGISTKHILIASGDDRIYSVPRNLLEPRRPTGVLKDVEKLEGLLHYHPLVPLITLTSPSYNQSVHLTTTIMSAPTNLESQSLVLAFGGPDIFFSRVAPSKGFDLLPEDFNRILLIAVLLGLLTVLVVVKIMSRRKSVKFGWT